MHDAVFKKNVFAVDGPDGEHDLEDVVSCSTFIYCSTLLHMNATRRLYDVVVCQVSLISHSLVKLTHSLLIINNRRSI